MHEDGGEVEGLGAFEEKTVPWWMKGVSDATSRNRQTAKRRRQTLKESQSMLGGGSANTDFKEFRRIIHSVQRLECEAREHKPKALRGI